MVGCLKNIYLRKSIAILGSGPSLEKYLGDADVSIAVNGGAASNYPYTYFMCGDRNSFQRPWFLSSLNTGATRIVASFVAPHDPVLYPDDDVRNGLQEKLSHYTSQYSWLGKTVYHKYRPDVPPRAPHLYFQYAGPINRFSLWALKSNLGGNSPGFLSGASISGVALQLAAYMGAGEVNLYGVDMNNFDGRTYLDPKMNSGLTKPTHATNLQGLIRQIRKQGTTVQVHGNAQF